MENIPAVKIPEILAKSKRSKGWGGFFLPSPVFYSHFAPLPSCLAGLLERAGANFQLFLRQQKILWSETIPGPGVFNGAHGIVEAQGSL